MGKLGSFLGGPQSRVRRDVARGLLVCLLVTGAMLAASARSLHLQMNTLNAADSDNTGWLVSQLDVDYKALSLALSTYVIDRYLDRPAPAPEASFAEVMRRFDIFYSRIDTVAASMARGDVPPALSEAVDRLRRVRDDLAVRLDALDQPDRAQVIAISDDLAAQAALVRDVTTSSLHFFVNAAMEARIQKQRYLKRFLLQTLLLLLVNGVACIVAFFLWRRVVDHATQLQRASETLTKAFRAALSAVVVTDMDGRILMVNSAAGDMFRMPEKDMPGRNVADVMVPDHLRGQHETSMKKFVETGERNIVGSGPVRLDAKRSDGSQFRAELSINTDTDLDGNPILIRFISDVSQIEAAERKLESARDEAQRLAEAKTMLLATMSHEMRTPLHGVIAALDLIDPRALMGKDLGLVQIAQNCSERALHHINDVLDITRLGEGSEDSAPYRPVEIAREIVAELTPLATEKSTKLRLNINGQGAGKLYLGSPNAFSRAIYNLVGNAVKYTRNGHVDLFLDFDWYGPGGHGMWVRVRDDGPGIAPEDINRIFQAFETGAPTNLKGPEGTGLGLPIARMAVQRLGGTLSVSSRPGHGSEFYFDIPLEDAPVPGEPAFVAAEPAASHQETLDVLVVDDASVNVELMRETVARLGHRVTTAQNGLEAVNKAAEHAFDVILMDINMPVMNGIEASRRIREGGLSRNAHIVAVTAISEPERKIEIFAAGLNAILVKPTRLADVAALLASLDTDGAAGPSAHPDETTEAPETLVAALEPLIGRAKAVDLIRKAVAEIPEDLLSDATDLPVTEQLVDQLHKAAGVTGTVGFATLSRELFRAERAAARGDATSLAECRQRIADLVRSYAPGMKRL